MPRHHARLVLWLTLPVVALFVVAVVAAKLMAAPAPAKAASLACSQDINLFYGLDNTIHPGEIGFRQSIGCNQATDISVGSCLEQLSVFGTWIQQTACSVKTRENVLALTHSVWYSCTDRSTFDTQTYRGKSSFHVTGLSPNIDVVTGQHGSRCLGPVFASSG